MNLKKLSLGLVALVGFGLMVTLNAFTNDTAAILKYRYNGTNAAGTTTLANWTDVSSQPNPLGCDGEGIPCLVEFRDDQYADMAAFIAAHNTPALIASSPYVTAEKDEQ